MAQNERPYERLQKYGTKVLSDAELLAIIIKAGIKTRTSVDIARELLTSNGGKLSFLEDISLLNAYPYISQ